jgi:hypothetical protein
LARYYSADTVELIVKEDLDLKVSELALRTQTLIDEDLAQANDDLLWEMEAEWEGDWSELGRQR